MPNYIEPPAGLWDAGLRSFCCTYNNTSTPVYVYCLHLLSTLGKTFYVSIALKILYFINLCSEMYRDPNNMDKMKYFAE